MMYKAGSKFICYRISEDIAYKKVPKVQDVYILMEDVDRETRAWVPMRDASEEVYPFKLKDFRLVSEEKAPIEPLGEPQAIQILARLVREKGTTYFEFKIGTMIQELYKSMSEEEVESEKWPGHKFYYIPSLTKDNQYKSLVRQYGLYDDFGKPIFETGLLNIAWLRTVGGQGKIKINDMISLAQITELMKNTTSFIKVYFENYYRDAVIGADIKITL